MRDNWISVEDRMPETDKHPENIHTMVFPELSDTVLVRARMLKPAEGWIVLTAYLCRYKEYDTGEPTEDWHVFHPWRDDAIGRVTHWMPLPEMPE